MKTANESKQYAFLALRTIQIISIGCVVSGFIWSSSDWLLLTVLLDSPVTPLSVLLMLYGSCGSIVVEGIMRQLERHYKKKVRI